MKKPNPRPPGRAPLVEGVETITVSLRMTPEQRAELHIQGGASWIRDRLDKAKRIRLAKSPMRDDIDVRQT